MLRDLETAASLDRVDLDAWELHTNAGTVRLTMEPDGPFKRVVRIPDTLQHQHQVAAKGWAMRSIAAELRRDDLTVRFTAMTVRRRSEHTTQQLR